MSEFDFEVEVLTNWLVSHCDASGPPVLTPLQGGGSCDMYALDLDGCRWVIKRAPLSGVADSAHDVAREYRIIDALQRSDVRVPELLASCDDPDVLGAPFYIMKYVEGEVIRRRLPDSYVSHPELQITIGEELIDALVELHGFEWRGTSFETIAHPENFLHRQVNRWMSQLEGYRNRDLPGVDEVADWLDRNRPGEGRLTVMHGDYKVDNTIFSCDLPPRILTIVDFEMTTVGDPLIDLAWAMIFWPEEDNLIAIAGFDAEGGMHRGYCQSADELIARYVTNTGFDLGKFGWYQAFAAWKLAIVLEASYAKFRKGESRNPNHEFFGFLVDQLLQRARRFAQ